MVTGLQNNGLDIVGSEDFNPVKYVVHKLFLLLGNLLFSLMVISSPGRRAPLNHTLLKTHILLKSLGLLLAIQHCYADEPTTNNILFISSLKHPIEQDLTNIISDILSDNTELMISQLRLSDISVNLSTDHEVEILNYSVIVAMGQSSCEAIDALDIKQDRLLICSAIPSTWTGITAKDKSTRFDYYVFVDQPVSRQIRVANTYFPSLKRFGVLSSESYRNKLDKSEINGSERTELVLHTYQHNERLRPQIKSLTSGVDALLAVTDFSVFNRSNFSTILMTSYGYGLPIVGLNKSYVKSGALISTFSSLEQVLDTILSLVEKEEQLKGDSGNQNQSENINELNPTGVFSNFFHIELNLSVARSLDLKPAENIESNYWYVDEDFM